MPGHHGPGEALPVVEVVKRGQLDPCEAIRALLSSERAHEAGCIVCFIGVVRGRSRTGELVEKAVLKGEEGPLKNFLTDMAFELEKEPGVIDIYIGHTLGTLSIGDVITTIAVLAVDRASAFTAARKAIDTIKEEAPVELEEIPAR